MSLCEGAGGRRGRRGGVKALGFRGIEAGEPRNRGSSSVCVCVRVCVHGLRVRATGSDGGETAALALLN